MTRLTCNGNLAGVVAKVISAYMLVHSNLRDDKLEKYKSAFRSTLFSLCQNDHFNLTYSLLLFALPWL